MVCFHPSIKEPLFVAKVVLMKKDVANVTYLRPKRGRNDMVKQSISLPSSFTKPIQGNVLRGAGSFLALLFILLATSGVRGCDEDFILGPKELAKSTSTEETENSDTEESDTEESDTGNNNTDNSNQEETSTPATNNTTDNSAEGGDSTTGSTNNPDDVYGQLAAGNSSNNSSSSANNTNSNLNTVNPSGTGNNSDSADKTDSSSSTVDTDKDGLTDKQETTYLTDPENPDSDGDGFLDGFEVKKITDPTSSASYPNLQTPAQAILIEDADVSSTAEIYVDKASIDSDQDYLTDEFEVKNGLDEQDPDQNDDGIIDGLQTEFVSSLAQ